MYTDTDRHTHTPTSLRIRGQLPPSLFLSHTHLYFSENERWTRELFLWKEPFPFYYQPSSNLVTYTHKQLLTCSYSPTAKLPFFFFLALPMAYGSPSARDQTHATAATRARAMTTLDP